MERQPLYRSELAKLLETGWAYPCFCTRERLEALRAEQMARKSRRATTAAAATCRGERERLLAAGTPHVYRFAVPLTGETTWEDAVKGRDHLPARAPR